MSHSESDDDDPVVVNKPLPNKSFSIENLLGRPEPKPCLRWQTLLPCSTNYFSGFPPKQICPIPPNILVPKGLFDREKDGRKDKEVKTNSPCSSQSSTDHPGSSQTAAPNSCEGDDSDGSENTIGDDTAHLSSAFADREHEIKMAVECSRYKKKRPRTAFSVAQIRTLELEFERNRYLTGSKRKELSKQLKLSETQIKIWFQNRRTKLKRKNVSEMESWVSELYSPLGPMAPRPLVIGDQLYLFNNPASESSSLSAPCFHIHPPFDSCRNVPPWSSI